MDQEKMPSEVHYSIEAEVYPMINVEKWGRTSGFWRIVMDLRRKMVGIHENKDKELRR